MKNDSITPQQWWWYRRIKFNTGLLVGGMVAYVLITMITLDIFEQQYFYITTNKLVVQIVVYSIYMVLANITYTAGSIADLWLNHNNSQPFRENIFTAGYWFAVSLPGLLVFLFFCVDYLKL